MSDCVCMPIITTFVIRQFLFYFDSAYHTRRREKMTILCLVLFSALLSQYAVIAFYYIPRLGAFILSSFPKKMRVSADLDCSLWASFEHELWGIKLSHHRIPIIRFLFFHLILTSGETFSSRFPALVDLSNLFS